MIEEEDEVRYPLLSTAQEADQVTGILVVLPSFKHESLVESDAAFPTSLAVLPSFKHESLVESDAAFPTSLAALTSAFAAGFMSANEPEL